MNQNKVVLDFTQINSPEQEVAIMPANLAKKLMQNYATKLQRAPVSEIIESLTEDLVDITVNMDKLSSEKQLAKAVQCALEFVQTRQLIENVVAENWNAYAPIESPIEIPMV